MLSVDEVLFHVKSGLGYPMVTIEYDDDDLLQIVRTAALREFSRWVPDISRITIYSRDKVSGSDNRFYIHDPDGREIIGIVDVYVSQGLLLAHGYPSAIGFQNYENLPNFMIDLMRGETAYEYSRVHHTFSFIHPNIIEIYGGDLLDSFIVKYSRVHSPNFETIPSGLATYFLDLALAYCKIRIGELRSKYTSYSTNMGEIPLNLDIKNEGENLRQNVLESLKTIPPTIIVDVD